MKTLLFVALLCVSALRAQGPPSIITYVICAIEVDGFVEVENITSCYAQSGPAYVVSAGADVQGFCTNGQQPEVTQAAFAACNTFRPTAVATGSYFPGFYLPSQGLWQAGYVQASADLTGIPGNPSGYKSKDCNGIPYQSVSPSGPC